MNNLKPSSFRKEIHFYTDSLFDNLRTKDYHTRNFDPNLWAVSLFHSHGSIPKDTYVGYVYQ